uniref:Transposase n=1 Tax=Haemonchus contortus TaxID=6289 RepID=A0A7I4XXH7_HAECO
MKPYADLTSISNKLVRNGQSSASITLRLLKENDYW